VQNNLSTKGKKKTTEGGEEEEASLKSYPDIFLAHVELAQFWHQMLTSSVRLSKIEEVDKDYLTFEHPKFGDIKY
jgi:hypothetical protein